MKKILQIEPWIDKSESSYIKKILEKKYPQNIPLKNV